MHSAQVTQPAQATFIHWFYQHPRVHIVYVTDISHDGFNHLATIIFPFPLGERVAEISKEMERKILILGSTDLTHYGYNYGYTPKGVGEKAVNWVKHENDKNVIDLMLEMDAEGVIRESIQNNNACCSGAVATAIAAAKRLGAKRAEKLIYTTSYDIRPDSSFVGYVGIIFVT